jgi:hypothetical protein
LPATTIKRCCGAPAAALLLRLDDAIRLALERLRLAMTPLLLAFWLQSEPAPRRRLAQELMRRSESPGRRRDVFPPRGQFVYNPRQPDAE